MSAMEKRGLDDIVVRKRQNGRRQRMPREEINGEVSEVLRETHRNIRRPYIRKRRSYVKYGVVIVAAAGLILAYLSMTGEAVVSIRPRMEEHFISGVGLATPSGENSERISLPYTKSSLEETRLTSVPSTGVKKVDQRASGRIRVFNDYSSEPQRLIARTRFQTPGGQIYRIQDPITVPGVRVEGGERVMGSIEVEVTADRPGEEYNIGRTDFTIPGLKGDPRYQKMFARSETQMTGGFSGVIRIVDEDELEKKTRVLKEEIAGELQSKLDENIGEEQITFPNAVFVEFETRRDDRGGEAGDPVEVSITGILHAMLFDTEELSDFVVTEFLEEDLEGDIVLYNPGELAFSLVDKDISLIREHEPATFQLEGEALLLWRIDRDAVKTQLAGLDKDPRIYQGVFEEHFPNIVSASTTSFSPFWASTFPKDIERIRIKEVVGRAPAPKDEAGGDEEGRAGGERDN